MSSGELALLDDEIGLLVFHLVSVVCSLVELRLEALLFDVVVLRSHLCCIYTGCVS